MALITSEENLLYVADKMFDICNRKDFKVFDGFFPIVPELFDDSDGNYVLWLDAMPRDLENPVNVSAFKFGNTDGNDTQRKAQLYRLRSISRQELRKRTGAFAINPYCFEVGFENSKRVADAYFTNAGKDIKPIKIANYEYTAVHSEMDALFHVMCAVQFNLENQNYVYLKPEEAELGFRLPLDDLGQLKELFALRDVPDGKKRRVALRNWVSRHLRRTQKNPSVKTEVRRHLRGREDFSWFGMSGYVVVNEPTEAQ